MNDWAAGIENRNYGLRYQNGLGLRDLLKGILLLIPIVLILLLYTWVRTQNTSIGYKIQELHEMEASLLETQNDLIVEEENLQNPERIEYIARTQLGMKPMTPDQVLAPRTSATARDRSVIAMRQ